MFVVSMMSVIVSGSVARLVLPMPGVARQDGGRGQANAQEKAQNLQEQNMTKSYSFKTLIQYVCSKICTKILGKFSVT